MNAYVCASCVSFDCVIKAVPTSYHMPSYLSILSPFHTNFSTTISYPHSIPSPPSHLLHSTKTSSTTTTCPHSIPTTTACPHSIPTTTACPHSIPTTTACPHSIPIPSFYTTCPHSIPLCLTIFLLLRVLR